MFRVQRELSTHVAVVHFHGLSVELRHAGMLARGRFFGKHVLLFLYARGFFRMKAGEALCSQ